MTSFSFAFFAGISLTMQNSFNGLLAPLVGAMGVSLVGFIVQSILMISYQLKTVGNLRFVKKVPMKYRFSGTLGTFIVGLSGLCVAKMGSAVTQCCSIADQILMSAFIDHFGLFQTERKKMSAKRLPGFGLILTGVAVMTLIGGSGISKIPVLFVLLDLGIGALAVAVRAMNHRISQYAGSVRS